MKRTFTLFALMFLLCLIINPETLLAQKQVEKLNRGTVAIRTGNNNFISWRWLGTEPTSIRFNLYRNGTRLNNEPLTVTNFTDNGAPSNAQYQVRALINGVEQTPSETVGVWGQNYLEVPLQVPAGGSVNGSSFSYTANDCSVGDLDGDGQYEIILKWEPSNAKDNSQSGYTGDVLIDAYKLDGTRVWRINLGRNIRAGAHYTQFMVYDFDGDGKAEMMCKTADATVDGTGVVIGNANADHRNSSGYILSGPEFLTVFNGETGKAMATTNYIPARGNVGSWGDNYGNRVDRFLAGVAYLDGQRPSAVFCRGYYTRSVIAAWDWRNGQLTHRWTFDTNTSGNGSYAGKGCHSLSIADVDGDGRDEIIYGAMVVDDNGRGLHTTSWGHGDALHVSDFDPDRPGQEIFMPVEWASANVANGRPAVTYRDARTGQLIWGKYDNGDFGRGVMANIDDSRRGAEAWASGGHGLFNIQGNRIGNVPNSINHVIWWDGDLARELLNSNAVDKWNVSSNNSTRLLTATGCSSINGTKSNPNLQADLFGDWREEVIFRTTDNRALRIFSTTIPSTHRIRTLMHDPQYRVAIAWQNVAYNQPPHPSFYVGTGMNPPTPDIVMVGFNADCNGTADGTALVDACGQCAGGTTGKVACTGYIEGTKACEYTGAVETEHGGFIGDGYLNGDNALGNSILWTVNAPSAMEADITFRYANGASQNRSMQLKVNGVTRQASFGFESTGTWTNWTSKPVRIPLVAGVNTIELTALTADGGPNFDIIGLYSPGLTAASCLITDISNIKGMAGIMVYPNPFKDALLIKTHAQVSYELLSLNGIIIRSGTCDGDCSILQDVPSGYYLLKLMSADQVTTVPVNKH